MPAEQATVTGRTVSSIAGVWTALSICTTRHVRAERRAPAPGRRGAASRSRGRRRPPAPAPRPAAAARPGGTGGSSVLRRRPVEAGVEGLGVGVHLQPLGRREGREGGLVGGGQARGELGRAGRPAARPCRRAGGSRCRRRRSTGGRRRCAAGRRRRCRRRWPAAPGAAAGPGSPASAARTDGIELAVDDRVEAGVGDQVDQGAHVDAGQRRACEARATSAARRSSVPGGQVAAQRVRRPSRGRSVRRRPRTCTRGRGPGPGRPSRAPPSAAARGGEP